MSTTVPSHKSIFESLLKNGPPEFAEFQKVVRANGEDRNLVWSANIWLDRNFFRFKADDLAKLLSPERRCPPEESTVLNRGTHHWKLKRSVFKNSVESLTYAQLLVIFRSKSDEPLPHTCDSAIIAILTCFSKEKCKGCSRDRDNSPTRK